MATRIKPNQDTAHFGRCRTRFQSLVLVLSCLLTSSSGRAAELHVFAAASLTDALTEIAGDYRGRSPDKLQFNFGASSMLARQIEEGAPADIFFSADEAKMDALEKKGLILTETRTNRLSNSLVIIVSRDHGIELKEPKELAADRIKRLVLAEPRTVPAGIYAREYLQQENLWAAMAPKVVPTENVRAALAAVEAGNAEAGIVYKTDAAISKKVRVAYEVPPDEGPTIRYPMAVMKDAREMTAARQFLSYLASDEAGRVFRKFGFIVRQ